MGEAFEPSKHLTKLKGKDYLEVKWRLVWLRAEHPDAHIATEAIRVDDTFALFKATVTLPDDEGSASGHGSETKADFGDFIEKAETKAIGRALGALGYGTQFCDDFDFSADAKGGREKVVDSPVDRRAAAPASAPRPPAAPNAPTAAELAKQAVAKGLWDAAGAKAWCEARGVKRIDEAPEVDRVALAHELANRLADQP